MPARYVRSAQVPPAGRQQFLCRWALGAAGSSGYVHLQCRQSRRAPSSGGLRMELSSPRIPVPVNAALLNRGRDRFDIYCSPCHGRVGDGHGMIAKRGFIQPADLHSDRVRHAPPGYLYGVIANGYGAMPDYGDELSVQDRWAVVAYIRALELSRHATIGRCARRPAAGVWRKRDDAVSSLGGRGKNAAPLAHAGAHRGLGAARAFGDRRVLQPRRLLSRIPDRISLLAGLCVGLDGISDAAISHRRSVGRGDPPDARVGHTHPAAAGDSLRAAGIRDALPLRLGACPTACTPAPCCAIAAST